MFFSFFFSHDSVNECGQRKLNLSTLVDHTLLFATCWTLQTSAESQKKRRWFPCTDISQHMLEQSDTKLVHTQFPIESDKQQCTHSYFRKCNTHSNFWRPIWLLNITKKTISPNCKWCMHKTFMEQYSGWSLDHSFEGSLPVMSNHTTLNWN